MPMQLCFKVNDTAGYSKEPKLNPYTFFRGNYMKCAICIMLCFLVINAGAQSMQDAILGRWESTEKNLIVQVYKQGNAFKAKIVWFHDDDDTITPVEQRLDTKNPDKNLRTRKIVGADVLSGLIYNPKQNKWVNGRIYDSSSGRTWDATVWLTDQNTLRVRGFYLVRLLGKTLIFTRK